MTACFSTQRRSSRRWCSQPRRTQDTTSVPTLTSSSTRLPREWQAQTEHPAGERTWGSLASGLPGSGVLSCVTADIIGSRMMFVLLRERSNRAGYDGEMFETLIFLMSHIHVVAARLAFFLDLVWCVRPWDVSAVVGIRGPVRCLACAPKRAVTRI